MLHQDDSALCLIRRNRAGVFFEPRPSTGPNGGMLMRLDCRCNSRFLEYPISDPWSYTRAIAQKNALNRSKMRVVRRS